MFLYSVEHPGSDENASAAFLADTLADAVADVQFLASMHEHELDMPDGFGSQLSDALDLPWEFVVSGSTYKIEAA
jgi:hypothetical protein